MGSVWAANAPKIVARADVPIELFPGYEIRSRSTGGFIKILGIGDHHDAISAWVPEENRSRAGWTNTSNPIRPVGNVRVPRDGTWVFGALGATNTQGRGPGLQMSQGYIPENMANHYFFSLEPSNDGIGQIWTPEQEWSIPRGSAALTLAWGLHPNDNRAHFQTAPGRKVDPSGPSIFTGGQNRMWDMGIFVDEVIEHAVELFYSGKSFATARPPWLPKQGPTPIPIKPPSGGNEVTQQQYAKLMEEISGLRADVKALGPHVRTQTVRQNWVNNVWAPRVGKALADIGADVDDLVEFHDPDEAPVTGG